MVLKRIVTQKKIDLAARMATSPLESFRSKLTPAKNSLYRTLKKAGVSYILECKKASPSKGVMRPDFSPADIACAYMDSADAISVITDEPFFHGKLEYITKVRAILGEDVPILCKDFVIDPYQVYEARKFGADAILLMLSVLTSDEMVAKCLQATRELNMEALVEVHTQKELKRALSMGAQIIGINNRDLNTLEIDLATTESLAPEIPDSVAVVSESGILNHGDIVRLRHKVDGFLIGSIFMQSSNIKMAVREVIYGRVKVCGLTNRRDAQNAFDCGARFGGLIFYPKSPRAQSLAQARTTIEGIDMPFVGVFVDEDIGEIAKIGATLNLAAIQLHGNEDANYIARLKKAIPKEVEIWKAFRVANSFADIEASGADRLLVDTYVKGALGGTGKCFDWGLVAGYGARSEIILAGGLNPKNAALADQLSVYALDVGSGIEAQPGRKSLALMQGFFGALKNGDLSLKNQKKEDIGES